MPEGGALEAGEGVFVKAEPLEPLPSDRRFAEGPHSLPHERGGEFGRARRGGTLMYIIDTAAICTSLQGRIWDAVSAFQYCSCRHAVKRFWLARFSFEFATEILLSIHTTLCVCRAENFRGSCP